MLIKFKTDAMYDSCLLPEIYTHVQVCESNAVVVLLNGYKKTCYLMLNLWKNVCCFAED